MIIQVIFEITYCTYWLQWYCCPRRNNPTFPILPIAVRVVIINLIYIQNLDFRSVINLMTHIWNELKRLELCVNQEIGSVYLAEHWSRDLVTRWDPKVPVINFPIAIFSYSCWTGDVSVRNKSSSLKKRNRSSCTKTPMLNTAYKSVFGGLSTQIRTLLEPVHSL